jgi:nitrate/TMAO reductase-like tetraheme cytochrome c subunit
MRLPPIVHNRLSYVGAAIAAVAAMTFGFLLVLHTFTDAARAPYASLVIFILVPAVLLLGAFLIPVGMLLEWRHVRRTGRQSIPVFPVLDLNDPRQRNLTLLFVAGSIVILFGSMFGSYQAYESTESVGFCGTLCHTVMKPEYTTYRYSPHARVKCVDCHVGPGADWYVKSKLSGLYQVYAVLFDKYPRPITGPITSLRPAQQTCEQCHWPEYFFAAQERRLVHFLPDAQNTRWEINLLVKIGGGRPGAARTGGIHWHMNISDRVEYIATDKERQQIPWMRVTNRETGKVTEYMSTVTPLSAQEKAQAIVRTMDCIDCHNRPSHIFHSPQESVNSALAAGTIDPTLPFIKKTAVELLTAKYTSTEEALPGIDRGLRRFYREQFPAVLDKQGAAVSSAISELQAIYQRTFFPYMRARWDEYPDNIGHLMFPGCFRCHDGQHQSTDGRLLDRKCTTCHTITAQGKTESMAYAADDESLTFTHPEDIGDAWQVMPCNGCHTGGSP